MKIITVLCLFLLTSISYAGRPVFEEISLPELVKTSSFIFDGYPSSNKPSNDCANKQYYYYVQRVLKGDKSFEGKVIPLSFHGYRFHLNGKAPSYAAKKYKDGFIYEQRSIIFYTNRNEDGCFEMTAAGAQDEPNTVGLKKALDPSYNDCPEQIDVYEKIVKDFPRNCKKDGDCEAFFIHPNSCQPPLPLNKSTHEKLDNVWIARMKTIRASCAKEWSTQPACEPEDGHVRCRNSLCERGLAEADKFTFTRATLQNLCAPNDGPAAVLNITAADTYPRITFNWWDKPIPRGKLFDGILTQASLKKESVQIHFCPMKKLCREIKNYSVKFNRVTDQKGTIEYSFETEDGEKFQGKLPVEFQFTKSICG